MGRPISDIKPNLNVADLPGLITVSTDEGDHVDVQRDPCRAAAPPLRHNGQQDCRCIDRARRHRLDPPAIGGEAGGLKQFEEEVDVCPWNERAPQLPTFSQRT